MNTQNINAQTLMIVTRLFFYTDHVKNRTGPAETPAVLLIYCTQKLELNQKRTICS